MDKCTRCGSESDVRMISDSFGICKGCRTKIDKEFSEEEFGRFQEVPAGTKCECCKKEIREKSLKPSGFGGYRNPVYSFTCERCCEESQNEYDRQSIEMDIRESCLNDY